MSDLTTLIQKVDDLQTDVTVIVTRYDEVLNATNNVVINVNAEIQKARDWAVTVEDTLVPSGNMVDEYSSLHWAKKAEAAAASTVDASNDAAEANLAKDAALASASSASLSEQAALTYRNEAQVAATTVQSNVADATAAAAAAAADRTSVASLASTVNDNAAAVAADRIEIANTVTVTAGHSSDAMGFANTANNHAFRAQQWASAPEGTIVDNGEYSSYHYMKKCQAIEGGLDISSKLGRTEKAVDSALLDGHPKSYYLDWGNLVNTPLTFTPTAHGHDFGDMSDVNVTGLSSGDVLQFDGAVWRPVAGTASGFAEATHGHAWGDISGTPITLDGYGIADAYTRAEVDTAIANATPDWSSLTGKPATFVPSNHTHTEVDIVDLDKYDRAEVDALIAAIDWASIPGKPTTLSGLGVTSAVVNSVVIGPWTISESSGDLVFSNGTNQLKLTSTGQLLAASNVAGGASV